MPVVTPRMNGPIRLNVGEPDRTPVITAPPKPALFAPALPSAPSGRKHTVAPGDTLYHLAKKYGVKMEDIVAANRDVLPSVATPLRRGAELKIP